MGELRRLQPDWQIGFSCFSPSAEPLLTKLPADVTGYLPYDRARDVTEFLDLLSPTVLVFTKLDLWPELATRAHQRGIKLGLITGTVRPHSGRLRWPIRALLHPGYSVLDAVGTASDDDARPSGTTWRGTGSNPDPGRPALRQRRSQGRRGVTGGSPAQPWVRMHGPSWGDRPGTPTIRCCSALSGRCDASTPTPGSSWCLTNHPPVSSTGSSAPRLDSGCRLRCLWRRRQTRTPHGRGSLRKARAVVRSRKSRPCGRSIWHRGPPFGAGALGLGDSGNRRPALAREPGREPAIGSGRRALRPARRDRSRGPRPRVDCLAFG